MSNKTILKILLNDIKQIFIVLIILLFFACCAAYGFFTLFGIIFVSTLLFGPTIFTGHWLEIIFISNTAFLIIGGISYWAIHIIKRAKENECEKN